MLLEIERDSARSFPIPPSAATGAVEFSEASSFRIIPPTVTAMVNVTIYLNETHGHRFTEYHAADELRRAWEGEIRFDADADDHARLESVYQIFNINHPFGYTDRSLSVADVVVLDGERRYAVERFGFIRLSDFAEPPSIATVLAWKQQHPGKTISDFYRKHHTCTRCRGKGVTLPFYACEDDAIMCCQQCGGNGAFFAEPVYRVVPRTDYGDELAARLITLSTYETGTVKMLSYLGRRLEQIGLRPHELDHALKLAAQIAPLAHPFIADRITRGALLPPSPAWVLEIACLRG